MTIVCLPAQKFAADSTGETQTGTQGDTVKVDLSVPARQMMFCAQETREIFGAAHLIDVLRGSRSKKVLKFEHEQLSSHGTGRDYSKEQWKHLAAQFVRQGLLERIPPHGSLRVTAVGKAVLQGQEVWGTLPGVIAGAAAAGETPEHIPELFEQLRSLRSKLASERGLPPYVIFHDRALIEMATYFPRTPAELGQIYGVGQHKLEEYAPLFLPVIQDYCREHDIEPDSKPASQSSTRTSPSGQQRTETVWEQFQAGKTISAIAADLGFTEKTILKHLKKAHEAGQELRVDGLKDVSELTKDEEHRVIAAFDECGAEYLRPVFDALGGRVSYDELHLWRLIYQVEVAGE